MQRNLERIPKESRIIYTRAAKAILEQYAKRRIDMQKKSKNQLSSKGVDTGKIRGRYGVDTGKIRARYVQATFKVRSSKPQGTFKLRS